MAHVNRRIGKSSETARDTADGTGGGVLDAFIHDYFNRSGNVVTVPGTNPSGLVASGGVVSDYTTPPGAVYRAHIFTSSGTFDVTSVSNQPTIPNNVDYLVVGGGGGGGGNYEAGGGGAGGYRTNLPEGPGGGGSAEAAYTVSSGSYSVVVGGGGVGGPTAGPQSASGMGFNGSQSYFHPTPVSYPSPTYIRSEGGGGGGTYSESAPQPYTLGKPGGSGGGSANVHPTGPAAGGTASRIAGTATPVPTQGYKGGDRGPQAHGPLYNGAGGGGAGAAGADQNNNTLPGSYGGNGKRTEISGPGYTIGTPGPASAGGTGGGPSTAVTGGWLAGGGGGGLYGLNPTNNLPQTRGAGGGGAGGNGGSPPVNATHAVVSTGGGGGGSGNEPHGGGHGGSGIVVLRYKIAQLETKRATGGVVSFANGQTIHTFLSSGTFTTESNWVNGNVTYLVVAGGGGGGKVTPNNAPWSTAGGGGGGGGLKYGTTPITGTGTAVTVTVGAGGNNATDQVYPAGQGSPSSFGTPITAGGGGYGGTRAPSPFQPGGAGAQYGGSGGGGTFGDPGGAVGADTDPHPGEIDVANSGTGGFGHAGATGATGSDYYGSGGGGAGGAGSTNIAGGVGARYTIHAGVTGNASDARYYAGGGGGGLGGSGGTPVGSPDGTGGAGGDNDPHTVAQHGAVNRGGGGGGGASNGPGATGGPFFAAGSGGSGVVIVAYPT